MNKPEWDLSRLTTGERCALRQAAGTLAFNVKARRAFYKVDFLRENYWEDKRYAALCMACLWREEEAPIPILPMEECLRQMYMTEDGPNEALAKRVDALLELHWDGTDYLPGKLLRLVKMMRAKGEYEPDFEALAVDFKYWDSENRSVQRRWLRTIYQTEQKTESDEQDGK